MTAAVLPARTTRRSVGLGAFRVLVASTYVVYIAVSFFRTENFLFALDALLVVAVLYALMSRAFAERTVAHGYLLLLLTLYVGSVLFAWVVLSPPGELASLKTLRNLLYCAGVFIVTLTYVTDRARLASLVRLMAMLSVFSAFYGLRQAVFGFWGFELDRLALMGSSLQEMLTLGRARLTSTFGDPLLCGFFMMAGLFLFRARWYVCDLSAWAKRFYQVGAFATFAVLVASLTRAPLLGFAVGVVAVLATDFRLTRRSLARIGWAVIAGLIFLGAVVWVVESGMLAGSENPVIRFLDTGLSSVWSLIVLFSAGGDESTYFLVGQSRDQRLAAWTAGIAYLSSYPLGAGFSNAGLFGFSLGDAGLLQVALLIGVPGATAYLTIIAMVFFRGYGHLRRTERTDHRRAISALLGLWIAILVTTGISSLATTSVASVITWLVAGALVNVRRIFPIERTTTISGAIS